MTRTACAGVVILMMMAMPPIREAGAQELPPPALDLSGAWAGFVDEAMIDHSVLGGGLRFHLTPRITVGPELTYMIGPGRDRDLFITGNLTFDFLQHTTERPPHISPYILIGAGYMQHRNQFEGLVAHEGAVTGGGGVRIRLSNRFSIAPEARIGWEPHVRVGATLTVRLGSV